MSFRFYCNTAVSSGPSLLNCEHYPQGYSIRCFLPQPTECSVILIPSYSFHTTTITPTCSHRKYTPSPPPHTPPRFTSLCGMRTEYCSINSFVRMFYNFSRFTFGMLHFIKFYRINDCSMVEQF